MHVVMGTVNTTDPRTISRNILFAVYHPKFEPLIGANDLVLIQASIMKKKKIILLILIYIPLKI